MKLKLFILFLLVFAAIGQTIFLNIDAKSNFLEEKSRSSYINSLDNELATPSVESSEMVVTIRQQKTEILNQDINFDTQETSIETQLKNKKVCTQKTEQQHLICQKAKEAAKQKENRVFGSNHTKNSTIQTP